MVSLRHQRAEVADDAVLRIARHRPPAARQRRLQSGPLEAARAQPGVPARAIGRQVLGGSKLAALTTEMIRAAVRTGEFGDPAAEEFLVRALAERRDAIRRAYLTGGQPDLRTRAGCGGHPDVQERGGGSRRRENAARLQGSLVDVRQHDARGDADRRDLGGRHHKFRRRLDFRATKGAFVKVELSALGSAYAVVGETGERVLPPRPERLEPGRFRTDGGITDEKSARVTILPAAFCRGDRLMYATRRLVIAITIVLMCGVSAMAADTGTISGAVFDQGRTAHRRCDGQDLGRTAADRQDGPDRRQRALPVSVPDPGRLPRRD